MLILLVVALYLTNHHYLIKAVRVTYFNGYKSAFLSDFNFFENRIVATSHAQPWPIGRDYNHYTSTKTLDSLHQQYQTAAYLVIQDDTLRYERYYGNHTDTTLSNTFSVTKSIVSLALGKALELGYIKNINERVSYYIPELKGPFAQYLTIRDLVSMRSGMQWDETYNSPFSLSTKAYFYDDLHEVILSLPITDLPNQRFRYQSGDTQLLSMVLAKALPITLSEFVSKHFWQPMGAEHHALWQYNPKDGIEKSYCCFATTARDIARFSKLMMHDGIWNDKPLLHNEYIKQTLLPSGHDYKGYGFGWWLGEYNGKKSFTMNGHLGQFVVAIPEDKMIIVRIGHANDGKKMEDSTSAYQQYVHQAYEIIRKPH